MSMQDGFRPGGSRFLDPPFPLPALGQAKQRHSGEKPDSLPAAEAQPQGSLTPWQMLLLLTLGFVSRGLLKSVLGSLGSVLMMALAWRSWKLYVTREEETNSQGRELQKTSVEIARELGELRKPESIASRVQAKGRSYATALGEIPKPRAPFVPSRRRRLKAAAGLRVRKAPS